MSNIARMLEVPHLDTTASLKLAAEQAFRLTGAEGVAIAIGNAMAMCCCASIGNAPDIGVLVGPDSGLSGLCMRTAELVQCDDAASDPRIDPVAGRQMNLRSVLIVPVIADGRLQAMLQLVSTRPHAFNAHHREQLCRMALDISALLSHAESPQAKAAPAAEQPSTSKAGAAVPRVTAVPRAPANTASGIAARTSTAAGSQPQTTPVAPLSSELRIEAAAPTVNERVSVTPVPDSWRSLPANTKTGIILALLLVIALGGYLVRRGGSSKSTPATATSTSATEHQAAAGAVPEISIEQNSLSVGGLEEARKVSGSAPQLIPGQLVRRVDPVYPASARARGIAGSVVLTAFVTKEGKVANVRLVRGPEELGDPAIEAVRQWVYQPYRLGGAPVAVETMITIRFTPRQQR